MEEKSVTILPPRLNQKAEETNTKIEEKAKLKVAAYCRVSTDSDEQASSYEAQIEHYSFRIILSGRWLEYLPMMAYLALTPKSVMSSTV